jgi:Lipocalin-like domain
MTQSNPLVGVWKIVSFQVEIDDAKERRDVYDERPSGFLIITDEGRMMALITAGDRANDAPPEALFDCMTAYSGRYRLSSDSLITKVDSAWHFLDRSSAASVLRTALPLSAPSASRDASITPPSGGYLTWLLDCAMKRSQGRSLLALGC